MSKMHFTFITLCSYALCSNGLGLRKIPETKKEHEQRVLFEQSTLILLNLHANLTYLYF